MDSGQAASQPGSPDVFATALAHPLAKLLFIFMTDIPTNQSLRKKVL